MGKINKENEQLNISKIGYYLVDDCNVPNMMVYKSMFAVKTHSCRGKIRNTIIYLCLSVGLSVSFCLSISIILSLTSTYLLQFQAIVLSDHFLTDTLPEYQRLNMMDFDQS